MVEQKSCFAIAPKMLNKSLALHAPIKEQSCFAPKMFEQKCCFAPKMFEQKSCFEPKMFEQKSFFTPQMFEQKSFLLHIHNGWTKALLSTKMFEQKSCFTPKMFEQNLNKNHALHPKWLNKSLALQLHPKC